ncbi:uncharacterized protein GGS25DRAFT_480706 [Hypoxylon fragiforme]|uniref:uncharacterized protein n=1 Tax=Hypoxylon fragiforme TaxID=63214 RepID=UPI0020C742D5|nr:uncharacterized protein GGS25DRAFT_480706 [Hypoxylon fragiforme]KAI2610940.1 hypothetical protein GGS25DRAFT_480706 [Hypoxylon fragiforme]
MYWLLLFVLAMHNDVGRCSCDQSLLPVSDMNHTSLLGDSSSRPRRVSSEVILHTSFSLFFLFFCCFPCKEACKAPILGPRALVSSSWDGWWATRR